MVERIVSCYRNAHGRFLVVPYAESDRGWDVAINRVQDLQGELTLESLGSAVRRALNWCDYAFFDPEVRSPAESASGEKTWRGFMKKWHVVKIEFSDVIKITPSTRDFSHRSFYAYLVKYRISLDPGVSDERLGEAIAQAFTLCRDGKRLPDEA